MPSYLSPSQVADQLGIDAGKVLTWIHAGELPAIDVSERRGGRPRWRIADDALAHFLAARSTSPRPAPAPRRRRPAGSVVEYY